MKQNKPWGKKLLLRTRGLNSMGNGDKKGALQKTFCILPKNTTFSLIQIKRNIWFWIIWIRYILFHNVFLTIKKVMAGYGNFSIFFQIFQTSLTLEVNWNPLHTVTVHTQSQLVTDIDSSQNYSIIWSYTVYVQSTLYLLILRNCFSFQFNWIYDVYSNNNCLAYINITCT